MTSVNIYKDGEYARRNPQWHAEESPWKAIQILKILRQNRLSPTTICDIGCGVGEVLKQLSKQMSEDCEFWGYEISPQAYALCQDRAGPRIHFSLQDIRGERGLHFDLVLVLDLLEHLEDYFMFLRDIKPIGDLKIFHFPLDLSVQTVLRRTALLKRRDMYAHLHYFTKETALRTLGDCGYEVLDHFFTPRLIEFGTETIQRILKLPRKLLFSMHSDLAVRVLGGYGLLVLTR